MASMSQAPLYIRADVWHGVLLCLLDDPKSILSLAQTCTAMRDLADHENIWRSVAATCWGDLAVVGRTSSYKTHKDLVMDDNRSGAALAVDCSGAVCWYRFQRPTAFYECHALQLHWWRTTNTLRLYFDARGEADLRLPLESSIAVIKLKNGQQATAFTGPCDSNRCSTAVGDGPANPCSLVGTYDLDASGIRLLVHAPDACHTFVQRPGHYKGVLIWHPDKTTELLKTLLLDQPADVQEVPPEQHSIQQAGCRSQAWEDWAEWALKQDGSDDDLTGASSSAGDVPVCNLLGNCLPLRCSRPAVSSSSADSTGGWRDQSSRAGSQISDCSGIKKQQQQQSCKGARHALIFCYANDLRWYHSRRSPDYCITPLAVADTELTPHSGAAVNRPRQPKDTTLDLPCRPCQYRGQISHHLQPKRHHNSPQLSKSEEGQLAAAWRRMPGALMQQCGGLDQQLQYELPQQERLRWAQLPPAVKARGDRWWV